MVVPDRRHRPRHSRCRYGVFKCLYSDRHASWFARLVACLQKLLGVKRTTTSSYSPASNGIAERYNQEILRSLRALCTKNHNTWSTLLPAVSAALRATYNTSLGMSPFELIHGRQMNLTIHQELIPDMLNDPNTSDYVTKMIPSLDILLKIASDNRRADRMGWIQRPRLALQING